MVRKIFITLLFLFFIFPSSVLAADNIAAPVSIKKKGVAATVGSDRTTLVRDVQNINSLFGASWYYDWGWVNSLYLNPEAVGNRLVVDSSLCSYKAEYVPMIWGAGINVANSQAYARAHPGSYWLIWNEPNWADQANLTPSQAAELYDSVRNTIKSADLSARLIVGGVALRRDDRNAARPAEMGGIPWLDGFISAYKASHNGVKPEFNGIHFHYYADCCFQQRRSCEVWGWPCKMKSATSLDTMQKDLDARLKEVISWMDLNYPGKEIWFTELGVLADPSINTVDFMGMAVGRLEGNIKVTRYAWFSTWYSAYSKGSLFTSNDPNSLELTDVGRKYQSLSSTVIGTATPLEVCGNSQDDDCDAQINEGCIPCPLKTKGDANCDGVINILDFETWRREFLGIDTTTKADFDSVGGVSILDFEIWRRGMLLLN